MAVKLISQSEYKIQRPGFEDVVFTESSKDYLVLPKAVKFASEHNPFSLLQSALEAGAFRIEADGEYDADVYQANRTVVAYRKDSNKFYAFIDDLAHPDENIILCRAQEGFDSHNEQNKWVLPVNDYHVKYLLKRAEKSGRVVEVTDEKFLELATEQAEGKSEFGQNDWNKATLQEISEPYAGMLHKRGISIGRVYHLTPQDLESRGVDEKHAEICWWSLGVYFAVYDNQFNIVGHARGIHGERKIK